jgi:hypothetical protein
MTKERQSPEELATHFAQGSPAVAAMDWVNAFLSRGLGAVWFPGAGAGSRRNPGR